MIQNPRQAFDELFGAGGDARGAGGARQTRGSMLDGPRLAHRRAAGRDLGTRDQEKLDRYLEQRAGARAAHPAHREAKLQRGGPGDSGGAGGRARLVERAHAHDVRPPGLLAFEQDLTRVSTLKLSRDACARVYPEERRHRGLPPPVAPRQQPGEVILEEFAQAERVPRGRGALTSSTWRRGR